MDGNFSSDLLDRIFNPQGPVLHLPSIDDEQVGDVTGIRVYGPRQLALARQHDGFVLSAATRTSVAEVLALYREIGISTPALENITFLDYPNDQTLSQGVLANREAMKRLLRTRPELRKIIPFFHSARIDEIIKEFDLNADVKNASLVDRANDKWLSQVAWRELGLPTCNGTLVRSVAEADHALKQLKKYSHICVKVRRSVSGQGVTRLRHADVLAYIEEQTKELNTNGLIIEPWFPDVNPETGLPSVQVYVGDNAEQDEVICTTLQVMGGEDNKVHKGNVHAPHLLEDRKLHEQIKVFCNWLRECGFKGIAGIDLIVAEGETRFSDPNIRQTGVTSAALLVHRLTGSISTSHWSVNNNVAVDDASSPYEIIRQLDRAKLLFRPDTKNGIVPTNLSTIPDGKIMIVALGPNQKKADTMLAEAKHVFEQAA